jgi:hypothetical protein
VIYRIDNLVAHRHALIITHPCNSSGDRPDRIVEFLKDGLDIAVESIVEMSFADALWLFAKVGYINESQLEGPVSEHF